MGKSSWYGSKKKKKGKGTAARKKQPIQFNPNSRNNSVRFINKSLSNIDLLQWVKQVGIKYLGVSTAVIIYQTKYTNWKEE